MALLAFLEKDCLVIQINQVMLSPASCLIQTFPPMGAASGAVLTRLNGYDLRPDGIRCG